MNVKITIMNTTRFDSLKKFLKSTELFLTFRKRGDIIENPFSDLSPKNLDTGKQIVKEVSFFQVANNLIDDYRDLPPIIEDNFTTVRQMRGLWGEDDEIHTDDVEFIRNNVPYYGLPIVPETKNADYESGINK